MQAALNCRSNVKRTLIHKVYNKVMIHLKLMKTWTQSAMITAVSPENVRSSAVYIGAVFSAILVRDFEIDLLVMDDFDFVLSTTGFSGS